MIREAYEKFMDEAGRTAYIEHRPNIRDLERMPVKWRGKLPQTSADVRALETAVAKRDRRHERNIRMEVVT